MYARYEQHLNKITGKFTSPIMGLTFDSLHAVRVLGCSVKQKFLSINDSVKQFTQECFQ